MFYNHLVQFLIATGAGLTSGLILNFIKCKCGVSIGIVYAPSSIRPSGVGWDINALIMGFVTGGLTLFFLWMANGNYLDCRGIVTTDGKVDAIVRNYADNTFSNASIYTQIPYGTELAVQSRVEKEGQSWLKVKLPNAPDEKLISDDIVDVDDGCYPNLAVVTIPARDETPNQANEAKLTDNISKIDNYVQSNVANANSNIENANSNIENVVATPRVQKTPRSIEEEVTPIPTEEEVTPCPPPKGSEAIPPGHGGCIPSNS